MDGFLTNRNSEKWTMQGDTSFRRASISRCSLAASCLANDLLRSAYRDLPMSFMGDQNQCHPRYTFNMPCRVSVKNRQIYTLPKQMLASCCLGQPPLFAEDTASILNSATSTHDCSWCSLFRDTFL